MKKLFVFLLLFTTFRGVSQNCPNGESTNLGGSPKGDIEESHANERIRRFRDFKNKPIAGVKKHLDSLLYDPCGFLDLLIKLNNEPKGYSGLRIYFASDTVTNKLMLIFAPTTKATRNGIRIHLDDTSSCYKIENNKAINISVRDASNYVRSYIHNQLGDFTLNGQNQYKLEHFTKPYTETVSLWYDISLFEPGTDQTDHKTGMITYLQYLINKKEIDNVVVNFGAFEHSYPINYYYQLTPIFNFYKKEIGNKGFFGTTISSPKKVLLKLQEEKLVKDKNVQIFTLKITRKSDYTDTGVPCPPPLTGEKCPGALLPQD